MNKIRLYRSIYDSSLICVVKPNGTITGGMYMIFDTDPVRQISPCWRRLGNVAVTMKECGYIEINNTKLPPSVLV